MKRMIVAGILVSAMPAYADDVLCRHIQQTYPSDHLLVQVTGNPKVQIHCGPDLSQSPVHLTFRTMADLNWYRSHEGYRRIKPGETDED